LAYEEEEQILNPVDSPEKVVGRMKSMPQAPSGLASTEETVARARQLADEATVSVSRSASEIATEKGRKRKINHRGRLRFVEMEAELSDEEGQGAEVSEDEDEPDVEEDGMLVRAVPRELGVQAS
jgi:hypothetical protein